MKNTVFVPVEITKEVIDGLKESESHFVFQNGGKHKEYAFTSWIKDNPTIYTHILLPVSITEEEIEKAEDNYLDNCKEVDNNEVSWQIVSEAFKAGINYLLNKAK